MKFFSQRRSVDIMRCRYIRLALSLVFIERSKLGEFRFSRQILVHSVFSGWVTASYDLEEWIF